MNRADRLDLLRGALVALLLVLATAALAADMPVDCAVVRSHVAEHGRAKAIAWARQQGYSWSEIWRIKRQCGV